LQMIITPTYKQRISVHVAGSGPPAINVRVSDANTTNAVNLLAIRRVISPQNAVLYHRAVKGIAANPATRGGSTVSGNSAVGEDRVGYFRGIHPAAILTLISCYDAVGYVRIVRQIVDQLFLSASNPATRRDSRISGDGAVGNDWCIAAHSRKAINPATRNVSIVSSDSAVSDGRMDETLRANPPAITCAIAGDGAVSDGRRGVFTVNRTARGVSTVSGDGAAGDGRVLGRNAGNPATIFCTIRLDGAVGDGGGRLVGTVNPATCTI